jgi:ribosomal protein S13
MGALIQGFRHETGLYLRCERTASFLRQKEEQEEAKNGLNE